MKKIISFIVIFFVSGGAFAQQQEISFWADPFNHPMLPLYTVTLLVFVLMIIVMFVTVYVIRILNLLSEQAEKERAKKLGITYEVKPGWWSRLMSKLNASVPIEQEKSIELDHNYDGIKELDNHLPPWWKLLFYGTIVWSAVYLFVYHISDSLPLSDDEYQREIALAEEQARKLKALKPVAEIDENTLTFSKDSVGLIEKGKNLFIGNNCGSCHRNDGGGNSIGPNLTDEYWLHGGDIKNIFVTIKNGVVEKGMPAWGKSLSPQDVRDVSYFILSIQGSNPENAKAPQGEVYRQTSSASDTTKQQASL